MLAAKFKNPKWESEIEEKGYVVIPNFLSPEKVKMLYELYHENHHERSIGCWNSLYDLPTGAGHNISEKIRTIVNPNLDALFKDWKFPSALFIVKNPGCNHESLVHRDDSINDETQTQYRQCWVPLVDITKENGALYVVPKSHKLFTDQRPMFAPWHYTHLRSRLEKEFVTLYPKAGDLVVYLEKTLHGSYLNISNETRPVFQGGIMHKDAGLTYTRYIPSTNKVESYEVDQQFFFRKDYLKPEVDKQYRLLKVEDYASKEISEEEVDAFYSH
jgi:hypothetical protein